MGKTDSNETSYFTRVMTTEVTHEIDTLGHYTGTFEAVAADTLYIPRPNFTTPISQPQIATVISNTDPTKTGKSDSKIRLATA